MSAELDRVLERVRQDRARALEELPAAPANPLAGVANLPAGLTVGAVVFDTVSGQHGEVVGGARKTVVVSTSER